MNETEPLGNRRHERFAQLLVAGKSQADAYREVYPASLKWQDKTVHEQASRLANNGKVSARVAALQAEAASHAVMGARELQERLSRTFRALDETGRVEEMVKVGALLAKVAGYEAPRNVTLRDGGVTEDYVPRDLRDKSDEELLRLAGYGMPQ